MTLTTYDMNDDQKIQLMKDTICKGSTDDEFQLFAYTCKRMGLDPFARQIFPVKRWNSSLKREEMTIQTGIDGYRLIADRTGRYSPGRDPEYLYDEKGCLICSKAFVMKQTPDGKWHEVAASAHFSEYAGLKKDGSPNHMWATKPHIMLSKCAEALALRKAFPAELSGVYTKEEMEQADNPVIIPTKVEPPKPEATDDQCDEFVEAWSATYPKELIQEYIKAKAHYEKSSDNQAVYDLIQKQDTFEKKFELWCTTNNKDFSSKDS